MLKNCGNDGTSFGFLIDSTETCPQKSCLSQIKAMRNAAYEEFSTRYDEQGEVLFEDNEVQPAVAADQVVETSFDIKSDCQTSQVEKAQFGISGSELFIYFTNPLDNTVFASCSSISNIFTNVTSLGDSSTCSFPNAKELRVVLGTSPSIKPGNSLTFKNVLTVKGGCPNAPMVTGSVSFSSNPDATTPVISLIAPSKITVCDSLSISASGTTGSGQLSFEWVLDTSASYVSNAGISSYLAGLKKSADSISISTTLLKSTVFGMLKFDLTVIDYFGQSSNASVIVELSSNTNDPQVIVNLPTKNQIVRSNDFTLTSSLIKSSCLNTLPTNVYTWKITPSLSTPATPNGGSISIPKYTLVEGTTYTFTLDVSVQQNGVEIGNSTSVAQLKAVFPNLVASIAGASPEGLGNTATLNVDASGSTDPNIANGNNPSASYAWTCCTLNSTSGVCSTPQCLASFTTLSAFTGNKFTQAPALPVGTFIFTVTYSHLLRSSKASKTVVIASGNNFVTLDSIKRGSYTFSTNLVNPTWTATVESGSFTVKSYQGSKFIVDVDKTSISVSGSLEVKAEAGGASATLKVPIEKVSSPFGGSVSLLFVNGTASPLSLNSGVQYIVEASGWKASSEIFYEFYGDFVGGQSFSKNNRFPCSPLAVAQTQASTVKATISVYSSIYEEYISTEVTLTVSIGAYTVPAGKTFEQAANETSSNIALLANSGDTTRALQAVGQSLNILKLSSAAKGSDERKRIKDTVSKGLQTIISNGGTLSSGTKLTVVSVVQNLIQDASEFTSEVKKNVISGLEALYNGVGSTFSGNSQVLNIVDSLFQLISVSSDLNRDLKSTLSLNQVEVAQIKNILRGVLRSSALGITDFTATPPRIDSASIKMQVNRFAFNAPTTELTLLSDSSVKLLAAQGISTGSVSILDLYTIKYPASYFPYVASLSRENISTPIVSFELYNGQSGSKIAVVNNPKILFTILSSNVAASSNCRYINEATSAWDSTGVNITTTSAGVSVVCDTTHLTDFAGFSVPSTETTTPTTPPAAAPDATAYLALLLLIIPVAVIVLIVGIIGVGAVVFIVTTIKKNGSEGRTPLNTQAAVGLEDLGI
jgi:hypothetical protein